MFITSVEFRLVMNIKNLSIAVERFVDMTAFLDNYCQIKSNKHFKEYK